MNDLIMEYIKSKYLAWAPSTLKSESARLFSLVSHITGDPNILWAHIQSYKPYTKQTIWTRVCAFWDYLIELGLKSTNPYKEFRRKNGRAFKYAYKKEVIGFTYQDTTRRIESISDPAARRRAKEMLRSAQRWCESGQNGDYIIGKGGKPRPNFNEPFDGPDFRKSYTTFYRALKKVGLKPHTLRKVSLTRLVEKGATSYDLMLVAGWSSPTTAAIYIQAKETKRLKEIMK